MDSSRIGNYNPKMNYDEETLQQQRDIEKQVASEQPLIGEPEDISMLEKEYGAEKSDGNFLLKVKSLKSRYSSLRRTRGDGNCFYRAFGFACLEKMLEDPTALSEFVKIAQNSKNELVKLGFPEFTLEDFHDVFMSELESVQKQCSLQVLATDFNDPCTSDYIVVYLRLLVSAQLQKESEFYSSFVEGGRTVKEFCNQEIEPMGKECDHLCITALTAATNIPICVEYMDRSEDSSPTSHIFPEGETPLFALLYRPGHYDILYRQK